MNGHAVILKYLIINVVEEITVDKRNKGEKVGRTTVFDNLYAGRNYKKMNTDINNGILLIHPVGVGILSYDGTTNIVKNMNYNILYFSIKVCFFYRRNRTLVFRPFPLRLLSSLAFCSWPGTSYTKQPFHTPPLVNEG